VDIVATLSQSLQTEGIVAIIKHAINGEIRIISIDEVRLVDETAIEQYYREIVDVLDKTDESCAVLHFGRVAFMSSAALGMLVRVNKKCKEYKIVLRLCSITTDIRQIFKITGLDKAFDIHADVAQAREAFKKSDQLSFRKIRPKSYDVGEDG
jgi:anti-anti-sigma factor